jgi:hypothetical protein
MAQLRDLIINGPSRFLGVANFNENANFNKDINLYGNLLPLTSNSTLGSSTAAFAALYVGNVLAKKIAISDQEDASTADTNEGKKTGALTVAGGINVQGKSFIKDTLYSGTGDYYIKGNDKSKLKDLELSGELTIGGNLSAKTLTITSTTGEAHIKFSRGNGNNYIIAPGSMAFIPGNAELKEVNAAMIIGKNTQTSNDYVLSRTGASLGTSSYYWGDAYVGTVYSQNVIPKASQTYSLGGEENSWGNTYTNNLYIRDAKYGYTGGRFYTTESESTTSQPTYLTIGNDVATGTKGSRYGILQIYDTSANCGYIRNNNVGGYGLLRMYGAKGGYHGILLGETTGAMAVMSKDSGAQGLYNQEKSKWIIYHNGNGNICIGGSTINSSHSNSIVLNGTTQILGKAITSGEKYRAHVYYQP